MLALRQLFPTKIPFLSNFLLIPKSLFFSNIIHCIHRKEMYSFVNVITSLFRISPSSCISHMPLLIRLFLLSLDFCLTGGGEEQDR